MKGLYLGFLILLFASNLFGQSDGDYRSRQTGNWTSVTTWQVFNTGSWHNLEDAGAGAYQNIIPSSSSGIITVADVTVVSIPNAAVVTADQIEFEALGSPGTLSVATGGTLIINDGAGDDVRLFNDGLTPSLLEVSGTLQLNNAATIVDDDYAGTPGPVSSDTYKVYNGGVHIHTTGTGVAPIPSADWQSGSTCQVNATSGTVPTISPFTIFHHFIWNGASQAATLNLNAGLRTLNGDLSVTGTNGQLLTINGATSYTLNIGRDLLIDGNSRVALNTTANPVTMNIGRDFTISSSSAATNAIAFVTSGTLTLNITGNFNKSNISIASMATLAGGSTTMNLQGNFSLTGGTLTRSASITTGVATINFTGSSTRTFLNSGTISSFINFSIANGKTLNLGTSAMTGTGTFLLSAGGTLGVGSPDGLSTGTTLGNIRVSGARTYQANGSIIYNGDVAQNLGDEWGSSGMLNGVAVNLQIANTSLTGVTNNIIGGASLVGNLTLTTGSLNIGNSNILEVRSNFIRTNGTIGGDATSDLIFSGSGSLASLVFTPGMEFINNLTISRSTELVLGSDLTVSGAINLSGGNLNFSGRTLAMNGGSISTNGTGLRSTLSTSNLSFGGSTFAGPIPFSGSGNQLNKLTFNTNGGSYSWNNTVIVNDSVKLILGTLTHNSGLTMANNSDFLKGGGAITGVAPVVSGTDSYNLTYTGSGLTGVELPTSETALNNLIISTSGTVTLAAPVKVNGDLTLAGGTFDSDVMDIEIVGNFIANATSDLLASTVTFSGPSSTISGSSVRFGNLTVTGNVTVSTGASGWRIDGNLVNNGSLAVTSGNTVFGGTTSITGSSICSFRTVRIEGTLNAPTQMNIAVNFVYVSGTFNANSGTINFTGAPSAMSNVLNQTFHSILISGTLTAPPTLKLTGDFTDNGTFTSGSGMVVFEGTSTQLIAGSATTTFNNISITNTAGPPAVQVTTNKNLRGVLTLAAGTNFDPDGSSGSVVFTLLSTGDVYSPAVVNDASIASLPAGAVVSGNVNVQRYMALEGANNNRVYRYISSPVSNAPVSELTDDFTISGTFTGANHAGRQSMFGYDETLHAFFDFPANNVTETMNNGRGYSIFVYGNEIDYTADGNALWDVRGTINSGEISFNGFTTLTVLGDPTLDGFNLVGNPYPSTIDWDAASGWTKTGIANAIYMRNNGSTTPNYATYINGAGVNGGTRYIPIGQAFQVKATSTPIDFRANESVKVAGQQATYFREISYDKIRIALEDGSLRDEMLIRFTDKATEGFDPDWDAYKLANFKLNLSSQIASNEKFAINSLPLITCGKTVRLSVTDVPAGTYSLNFSEFETIPTDIRIELFDSFTATTVDVRQDTYYSFQVTDDLNSYGNNRFELRFITKDIPDFIVLGEDVCESSAASVKVTNSDAGVQYRIMKNGTSLTDWQTGTGAELSFSVPGSQLVAGENLLSVQASVQACEASYVDKQLKLQVVSLTEVTKTTNGSSCGAGKVTISASGASDGNYKWYETETDQVSISGAVNSTFITPELSKTKTYYVSTINSLGCESARKPVLAEVVYFEQVNITVSEESQTLVSSYESGNQWYYNGAIIPGATGKSLEVTETGLYEVEVSVSGCSSRASQEMIVLGSEGGITNGIRFYPNPVSDMLYIELPGAAPATGMVASASGQPIGDINFTSTETHAKGEFNFSRHAAGLYVIRVIQGKTIVHYKIIKK